MAVLVNADINKAICFLGNSNIIFSNTFTKFKPIVTIVTSGSGFDVLEGGNGDDTLNAIAKVKVGLAWVNFTTSVVLLMRI
jgi:Ca2+-binding RTX toxin-like protein